MINESNFSKREVNNQVKDYMERFCDDVELAFTDNPEDFGIKTHYERIHSSDVFYRGVGDAIKSAGEDQHCLGVEMESFALFHNANVLNKRAACILTISDSLVTSKVTTSEQRQTAFNQMMEIALNAVTMIK